MMSPGLQHRLRKGLGGGSGSHIPGCRHPTPFLRLSRSAMEEVALGPRGAGDRGLGSWLGTCPTWPA